jgi:hypothetical protein
LKSEVSYSEKDSYPKDTRQKDGGEVKPKISGEKKPQLFRVFSN